MCHQHIMHMFQNMRFCPSFQHMNFCPWFRRKKKLKKENERELKPTQTTLNPDQLISACKEVGLVTTTARNLEPSDLRDLQAISSRVKVFEYRELATATNNFRSDSLIGEGGFGQVYKGRLASTGQAVAVKVLNQTGPQGDKEFLVEVLMLSLLHHPNLVNMVGYCAEGNQRLLVYEYMPFGSLEYHLHDLTPDMVPLDWNTRMKIAAGTARGLDYLHNQADPPVIYRDLKCSNILLDGEFDPKLSDFGLAKFGPEGDKSHVSTRVMGTHGYCAPEYASTGRLTKMSDIYCFGVVLMELITGQRAYDPSRGRNKETLVNWVRPFLRDRKDFTKIADPNLKGQVPDCVLCKAIEVAGMCLRDKARTRPTGEEMVKALDYLASQNKDPSASPGRCCPKSEKGGDEDVHSCGFEKPKTPEIFSPKDDKEREQAVAEAKEWGETWREKKRRSAVLSQDELDR